MAILLLLSPFGVFYFHLEYFVAFSYIFFHFGMLQQEKSGNPGLPNRAIVVSNQGDRMSL
jgi:hypothetical protein